MLDPGGYRLLLVEAPDVPADELRAAVRWRIKDLIDFHIDDAVIDVFEMPPHARGGPHRMMYAVTAKAEVVKREIERIESAGLKLDVVDIPELSLRNIATLLESDQRGAAFLYLSERRSTLLLVRQGVLYLRATSRPAWRRWRRPASCGPISSQGLALEVRRSLDYFESHYEQTSIQQLHVSGLEAADREAIARELGLAVREVDLTTLFETDDVLSPELQRLCMPAIGAALRKDPVALCSAMYQQINLYQPIFRKQRQIFSAATMAQALGIVAAALLAHLRLWLGEGRRARGRSRAARRPRAGADDAARAHRSRLGRESPRRAGSGAQAFERHARRSAAPHRRAARAAARRYGRFLGLSRGAGAPAHAGAVAHRARHQRRHGAIELAGRSLRPELVPEYMQRLGSETALAGQRFDLFEIERDGENGEATFRATSRAALTLARREHRAAAMMQRIAKVVESVDRLSLRERLFLFAAGLFVVGGLWQAALAGPLEARERLANEKVTALQDRLQELDEAMNAAAAGVGEGMRGPIRARACAARERAGARRRDARVHDGPRRSRRDARRARGAVDAAKTG